MIRHDLPQLLGSSHAVKSSEHGHFGHHSVCRCCRGAKPCANWRACEPATGGVLGATICRQPGLSFPESGLWCDGELGAKGGPASQAAVWLSPDIWRSGNCRSRGKHGPRSPSDAGRDRTGCSRAPAPALPAAAPAKPVVVAAAPQVQAAAPAARPRKSLMEVLFGNPQPVAQVASPAPTVAAAPTPRGCGPALLCCGDDCGSGGRADRMLVLGPKAGTGSAADGQYGVGLHAGRWHLDRLEVAEFPAIRRWSGAERASGHGRDDDWRYRLGHSDGLQPRPPTLCRRRPRGTSWHGAMTG